MKRLLLLGATGKLGLAIQKTFSSNFALFTPTRTQLNVQEPKELENYIKTIQPHIVCNCIAFMGDACARNSDLAYAINRDLPANLAQLSVQYNHTLIHTSTEAVFSDAPYGVCYNESHPPSPINIYGQSKWEGEQAVQKYGIQYYIFRLPLLFGPVVHKQQFVEKMLLKVEEGITKLHIADDIISTPSYTLDIATEMKEILLHDEYGLFHLCNTEPTTYFELIRALMHHLYPHVQIYPAKHSDFPYMGRKNLRTPLSTQKRPSLRSWREALVDYTDLINK